jgi:hypothetical protein
MGKECEVGEEGWLQGCTCPGSNSPQEIAPTPRRRTNFVNLGRRRCLQISMLVKIADQIQRETLAAYGDKGEEAPRDFSRSPDLGQ